MSLDCRPKLPAMATTSGKTDQLAASQETGPSISHRIPGSWSAGALVGHCYFQFISLFSLVFMPLTLLWPHAAEAAEEQDGAPKERPAAKLPSQHIVARKMLIPQDSSGDGAAVAVISGEQLRQRSRTVAEVVAGQAGVHALQTGGVGSPTVLSVRGATTEQLAVYFDDAPLILPDGGFVDLADLPALALERIELFRGSVPVELGGQSMGGALRLVPRQPRKLWAEARANAGSFGTNVLEGAVAGAGTNTRGYLALRWLQARGDFPFARDPGTAFASDDDHTAKRENNALWRVGGLATAKHKLSSNWTTSATWLGASLHQGIAGPALYQARSASHERSRHFGVLHAQRSDAIWTGDSIQLTASALGARSEFHDEFGELGYVRQTKIATSGATAAVFWTAPLHGGPNWRGTIAARVEGGRADVDVQHLQGPDNAQPARRTTAAATLGLRVTSADNQIQISPSLGGGIGVQATGSPAQPSSADVTAWPWHAALSLRWQLTESLTLQLAGRRAMRLPNLQELFADTGAVRGNPKLTNESAVALDAGLSWQRDLGKTRIGVDARGFVSRAQGLIQLVQVGPNHAMYQNISAATLSGGELALELAFADDWSLSSQFAGLLAYDTSGRLAYDGRELPMRPQAKWATTVRHSVPFNLGSLTPIWWVTARGQSGYALDAANAVTLPARTMVAAGLGAVVAREWARIDLSVDNINNSANFDLVGYPLPARTIWLHLAGQLPTDSTK